MAGDVGGLHIRLARIINKGGLSVVVVVNFGVIA